MQNFKDENVQNENPKQDYCKICETFEKYFTDDSINSELDNIFHANLSKYLGWFSPASFNLALFDYMVHILISPDKQLEILYGGFKLYQKFLFFALHGSINLNCENVACGKADDPRFLNEKWKQYPFNLYSQYFLLWEDYLDKATKNVTGVSKHHENVVNFSFRQMLDVLCPSNYIWTNPEILSTTLQKSGSNLTKGIQNFYEDFIRFIEKKPPVGTEKFEVGVNLAVTKGTVIFRNNLIELIQYEPTTKSVNKEPILIVPAWIMKYYILDLSPHNSMVKYLVNAGHTVFMISWKNPNSEDRDLGLEDYVNLGVLAAIQTINEIIPDTKINAVGYCIGGTLLMLAAAYLAKINDHRLNTITLFAAQVDFKDAGELLLFIDDSQITFLEHIMWEKGYLDGSKMAGTFSMLHPIQLIWSRVIRDYLLGDREPIFDLMAWDYDTTRLPYKMHSEYLRKLYLNNDLVEGKFTINGKKIILLDINIPIFAVSTTTDHVAPWVSVYKIHYFTKSDITFVLTSGGHNAGIVSEPGHPHRSYQIKTSHKGYKRLGTEKWQKVARSVTGSWWIDWDTWLNKHSLGQVSSPTMGNPPAGILSLCDAPGTYVCVRGSSL